MSLDLQTKGRRINSDMQSKRRQIKISQIELNHRVLPADVEETEGLREHLWLGYIGIRVTKV